MYGVGCKVYGGGDYRLFCDSHPRGVDRCDMRAGIGAGREICHTAGDMRAERAECGKARLNRDSPSRRRPLLPIRWEDAPGLGRYRGGEGDMRADGARRDMGDTDIKKTPYREI